MKMMKGKACDSEASMFKSVFWLAYVGLCWLLRGLDDDFHAILHAFDGKSLNQIGKASVRDVSGEATESASEASKLGIRTLCKNNRHTTVTGWHDLCQRTANGSSMKFQLCSRVELQETAMTCHDLPQVIHVSYPLPLYYHILPVLLNLLTSVLAG